MPTYTLYTYGDHFLGCLPESPPVVTKDRDAAFAAIESELANIEAEMETSYKEGDIDRSDWVSAKNTLADWRFARKTYALLGHSVEVGIRVFEVEMHQFHNLHNIASYFAGGAVEPGDYDSLDHLIEILNGDS